MIGIPDWKYEVKQCIVKLYNHGKRSFTLTDMYLFIPELEKRTGRRSNIKSRIRENLQKLRDDGFIEFLDYQGTYRVR